MRTADLGDRERLLDLMADLYAESGYVLDRSHAEGAFTTLLGDSRLGRVWLIEQGLDVVGYIVVTFVFAMEHGGLAAWVDDLYVEPQARGAGLSTAALAEVRESCAGLGVRALAVEVGSDNAAAQAVYRSAGMVPVDRGLMMVSLADPVHEV
jgi:GNAT superfamily N-acetyltransferase